MHAATKSSFEHCTLLQAAREGNSEKVTQLLTCAINIDSCDTNGATALYLAVQNNHPALVEQLLALDANPNSRLKNGATPLHIAIINGYKDSVKCLLEHKASTKTLFQGGMSPFHLAAFWGQVDVIELLLQYGADASVTNRQGKTPLMIAKNLGDWEFVHALLNHQEDPHISKEDAVACLVGAASTGHSELVAHLLTIIDASTELPDGSTFLHAACTGGNTDIISQLLANKADIEAADRYGIRPLHTAVENNHLHVVALLLAQGATLDARIKGGQQALHIAAYKGLVNMTTLLIESGAAIDAITDKGHTPCYIASQWRKTEVLKALLTHKADPSIQSHAGESAYTMALNDPSTDDDMSRLLAGPSILRVWRGKKTPPGQMPTYTPFAKKEQGCAPGFIAESPTGRLFMAKLGLPERTSHVSDTLLSRKRDKCLTEITAVREKIAADLYALLGHGRFYVAKHRLAIMNIVNAYTKDNIIVQSLEELFNQGKLIAEQIKTCTHLLSKWVRGYQDLAKLEHCLASEDAKRVMSFMAFVKDGGQVPQWANIEGKVVPIIGVMEVLATARLLADTDVIGGNGNNAGFVIERDADKHPTAVRIVKIDAGESFAFSDPKNRLYQSFNPTAKVGLANKKDLQIGNMSGLIRWAALSKLQQSTFLAALKDGMAKLQTPGFLAFLIQRNGLFDQARAVGKRLITDQMIQDLIKSFEGYMKIQARDDVFGLELKSSDTFLKPQRIPFNPKAFGVANYTLEEMEALLAQTSKNAALSGAEKPHP